MEIFRLFGSIFIDGSQATDTINDVDNSAQSTGKTLGGMIGTAAKWGAGIAAGGVAAVGGLFAVASKASDTASEINDMSVRTGLSTTRLQELKFASEQSGVAFEAVQSAVSKMTMSMGKADEEGKGMALAFEQLGVKTRDSNGAMLETETVFNQTLVKLSEMTNETERNALGMQIFGKGFTELNPLVSGGAAGLAEMSAKAHELGLVLSEDAINAGDQFGDSLDAVKATLGGVVTAIGVELMPVFQTMMDWVMDHMPEIQSGIDTAMAKASDAISWLGENVLPIAIDAFNLFGDGIELVTDNLDIILPVITGVTAAIVAQMVINGLTKAYKAWQLATASQTAAQWLLNTALNANPLGVVALAVGALIAVGVLLWKNWDTVKEKAGALWTSMKDIFGKIGSFVEGVWDGIVGGIKGAINAIISAINKMIRGLNKIRVNVPEWVEDATGMSDFGINIPTIPMLAKGGNITGAGRVLVGEVGPEILDLPAGARVTPLDHESGGGYKTANIILEIEGRTFVQAIGQPLVDYIRMSTGLRG